MKRFEELFKKDFLSSKNKNISNVSNSKCVSEEYVNVCGSLKQYQEIGNKTIAAINTNTNNNVGVNFNNNNKGTTPKFNTITTNNNNNNNK